MSEVVEAPLSAGHEALLAGDWSAARDAFASALDGEETPEALAGMADALWWLGETDEAITYHERAYAEFRRRPDPAQAAIAGIGLYFLNRISLGNRVVSRGWLARVARLVEEFDLEPLTGWVALMRGHDSETPQEGQRFARDAREVAKRFGDSDLELCALSQLGAALVESGELEDGVALLDEAMAASLGGEGDRLQTVVFASCNMISSCGQIAEVERARQWIRAADSFTQRYGSPHVYTLCRAYYGSILYAIGDWEDAEREFEEALRVGGSAEPALRAQALAGLAELRLAQGKPEEAERFLEGIEDHRTSISAVAALRLVRGNASSAAALLGRRLHELDDGEDKRAGAMLAGAALCLERAALLELLSLTALELGSTEDVFQCARRLAELGEASACEPIVARSQRALGRAQRAAGDGAAALTHLERALSHFAALGMPLELARTRVLLAETLQDTDPEPAIAEARSALATFEELGAARDADHTADLLRSLGVRAARSGPRGIAELTKREREVLELLGEGLSNRELAERLFVTRKTVEHHVHNVLMKLDLRSRGEAAAYAVRHLDRDSAAK